MSNLPHGKIVAFSGGFLRLLVIQVFILVFENILNVSPEEAMYLRLTSVIRVSIDLHLKLLFYVRPPKSRRGAIYFVQNSLYFMKLNFYVLRQSVWREMSCG